MAIDLSAEIESPEVKPETVKSDLKKVKKKDVEPSGKTLTDVHVEGTNVWIQMTDELRHPLCGDQVFWFQAGEIKNSPCPAVVNVTPGQQRVLSLTVFTVNGVVIKDGVKHLSIDASPRDRELYGGWAWNRDGKGI